MNAIKNLPGRRLITAVACAGLVFGFSCNENSQIDFNATDNAYVQSEANSDAQIEETDDMAAVVISADASTLSGREDTGGREEITISDDRFNCAVVTLAKALNNVPLINPHGFITVDFGAGCIGPAGKTRNGKIIFEYSGRRFLPGSKIVTTFENYSVNGIKLEGTRTLTNVSSSENAAVSFSIVEDGMKVTYPDGTFITRSSDHIRTWGRATSPTGDVWTVTGSSAGTNRKGKNYIMTITRALVYRRICAITNRVFIPVQGTKELKVDSKSVSIDFGNGECNHKVTVTILGKSKEIELSADGN